MKKIEIKQWKRLKLTNEKDWNYAMKKIEIKQWKRLKLNNEKDWY